MTTTPHLIATFLTPWVLGLIACTLLFIGYTVLRSITGRVAPIWMGRRWRVTGPDTVRAAVIGVTAAGMACVITQLEPAPKWWSQPLHSGWEVSFSAVMMLLLVVAPLLVILAVWAAVICAVIVTVWLGAPADPDDPASPTRRQQITNVVVASWNAHRQSRQGTVSAERPA